MKKLAPCFLVILGLAVAAVAFGAVLPGGPVAPTPVAANQVQFAWNASSSDTNPQDPYNYVLEMGTVTGTYTQSTNVGTNLSAILSGLPVNINYLFVVVALDTNSGLVSPYSNQTNWTAPFQPGAPVIKARTILAQ